MRKAVTAQLATRVRNDARVAIGSKSPQEIEAALIERWYCQGDPSARTALVEHFTPLAHRLASRYRHSSESQDDLEQVACLGLLKAIEGYDPGRGAFARYAVPTILGELRRHFRDKGWAMHVPRS